MDTFRDRHIYETRMSEDSGSKQVDSDSIGVIEKLHDSAEPFVPSKPMISPLSASIVETVKSQFTTDGEKNTPMPSSILFNGKMKKDARQNYQKRHIPKNKQSYVSRLSAITPQTKAYKAKPILKTTNTSTLSTNPVLFKILFL